MKHELFSVCVMVRCYCDKKGFRGPKTAFWGSRALAGLSEARPGPLAGLKDPPWALLRPEFPVVVPCSKHHWQNCKHLGACWNYHGAAATNRTILRTKWLFNVCLCASPDTLNNPRAASAKPESFAPLATRKNNRENEYMQTRNTIQRQLPE